jgi:hypothetical protein
MLGVPCVDEIGMEDELVVQERKDSEPEKHDHSGEFRDGEDVLNQLAPRDAAHVNDARQQDEDES